MNLWKISTLALGGLVAAGIAYNHVPAASADTADQAIPYDACGDQGHMEAALEHLRAARHELSAASANKGGHREEAIKLAQGAINHVKAGCRFADDPRDRE